LAISAAAKMARRDYLIYRVRHSTPGSMPFAIRTSSGNLTICSAIPAAKWFFARFRGDTDESVKDFMCGTIKLLQDSGVFPNGWAEGRIPRRTPSNSSLWRQLPRVFFHSSLEVDRLEVQVCRRVTMLLAAVDQGLHTARSDAARLVVAVAIMIVGPRSVRASVALQSLAQERPNPTFWGRPTTNCR
jgi:hypothetical protein